MNIKDNLSLIDSNFQNQIEACKKVDIHELIENLSKEYNTIIKEDEHILSDGSKQLLSIARAVLPKAEILLVNEVTSNIVSEYKIKISNILKNLKIDYTIRMIYFNLYFVNKVFCFL